MSAKLFALSERLKLPEPQIDDFYGKAGFEKYSNSIWYCIHEIIEKDVAMLGKYDVSYDQKLVDRINAVQQLIISFRRYGMIAVNEQVQKSISRMLRNINQ